MQVDIAWDFPQSQEQNIDSFRIRWGLAPGSHSSGIKSGVDKTARTTDIGSLQPGTTYYVVISSLLGGDESAKSEELVITPTVPAPTNLREGSV